MSLLFQIALGLLLLVTIIALFEMCTDKPWKKNYFQIIDSESEEERNDDAKDI